MKFTEWILNSCAKNTNAGLANHGELNIDVMKQDTRPKTWQMVWRPLVY
ncbi:MAG: hypothetical protein LBB73_05010 [Dysgonamonadaceae bacterium]|jgi:hypothetical protein|nr:hypothetical protein [Dysgonamonadaceae bacterium]